MLPGARGGRRRLVGGGRRPYIGGVSPRNLRLHLPIFRRMGRRLPFLSGIRTSGPRYR